MGAKGYLEDLRREILCTVEHFIYVGGERRGFMLTSTIEIKYGHEKQNLGTCTRNIR